MPNGRYCRPCATAATAAWRDRHRSEIRAREAARTFTDDQQAVRRARAYLDAYVRRGKIARGRCTVCNDPDVRASWPDVTRPLEPEWLCAAHYTEKTTDRREGIAAIANIRSEFLSLVDEISRLPAATRKALHEEAARGPAGDGCRIGSVMYFWTLRRAFQRLTAQAAKPFM